MSEEPGVSLVRQHDTHRLIPSRYAGESVLSGLADSDEHLQDLFELESATNDRLLSEHGHGFALSEQELVAQVPHQHIINAAFTHPHPLGSRFNGPDRGAWYAGFELETSQAEVAFHKTTEYAEIGRFRDSVTYTDLLADFSAELHDLRGAGGAADAYLDPSSYSVSQALAERLLASGAAGVVYPSVRHQGGTCLAAFRPALVQHVRRGETYRFTWSDTPTPTIALEMPPQTVPLGAPQAGRMPE